MTRDTSQRPIVVQVVNSLALAGAEHVAVDLATHLDPERWDVRMLVVRDGPLRQALEAAGIPIEVTGYEFDHRFPGIVSAMARYLRDTVPEVVHTHLIGSDIVGRIAARQARVPIVMSTQHDVYERQWYFDLFRRYTGSRIAATVACSSAVERYCRDVLRIPAERLVHIDNGVDVDRFAEARTERRTPLTFGAVGTLIPAKGHDTLVRAFAIVHADLPGSRLRIAGGGPERDRLLGLADDLGVAESVELVGVVEDVVGFLRTIDVFVQPSLTEGLAVALLEAMAAGKPVVASDAGALPELLENGECGLLVPASDPDELAEALDVSATQLERASRYAARGLDRVREHYSLDREVAEYEELYQRLLRGEPAASS